MRLDPDKFHEWLASKSRYAKVGWKRLPDCCPIAQYLKYETGNPRCWASAAYYSTGNENWVDLPSWAKQFIWYIDDEVFGNYVTAERALEYLTRALRRTWIDRGISSLKSLHSQQPTQ